MTPLAHILTLLGKAEDADVMRLNMPMPASDHEWQSLEALEWQAVEYRSEAEDIFERVVKPVLAPDREEAWLDIALSSRCHLRVTFHDYSTDLMVTVMIDSAGSAFYRKSNLLVDAVCVALTQED